ncbi:hypothetical protein JOC95_003490 [Bacillus tianshenii]|uniref:Cyclic nucleotide-binding domain-containing protein n=2 Tax=Sutcliffiella tianshenii TaxID=1463404 RepID=A0ABS2P3R4_9BACI|nr:hypothetical protein [Bacillus tianshenii]
MLTSFLCTALLLGACGNGEQGSEEAPKNKEPEVEETASAPEENVEDAENGEKTPPDEEEAASASDGETLNPYIEESTGGKSEVLYSNKEPGFVSDENGFKVTVDEYEIVKVTDMNQSNATRFNDSTTGYIISALVSVDNQTGKPVYFNGTMNIRLQDEYTYVPSNSKDYIEDGKGLRPKGYEPGMDGNINMYEDGEQVSGLVTFRMSEDEYEMMKSVNPKFIIESSASHSEDFQGAGDFMTEKVFDFTYSGDHEESSAGAQSFYPDQLTTNNIADKEMIFEKTDINTTEKIEDTEITLEGVQYTTVIPTDGNESRFEDVEMVALTVKTKVKNNTDQDLTLFNLPAKVEIDRDRGYARNNGFAEPSKPDIVKPGEEAERYFVFLFRKDEFELFKTFKMEVGPFFGEKEYLFGEKTVTFDLPR